MAQDARATRQFAVRTMKYWMLETGLGITVVITAVLGLLVGAVVISQNLFALTQEHLPQYATLLALGFSEFRELRQLREECRDWLASPTYSGLLRAVPSLTA